VEFAKFKDVYNIKEIIVKFVLTNITYLTDNVNSKIVLIGLMTNVLPVKKDMFLKVDFVKKLIQFNAVE
jgi:hypothetical protein